ncbi:PREDICTED: chondroitin sulfate synthase 2 [Ceratosolen solmsi marchali]|uniref:Hexosyltransferase n=1 Tax=Ceratosolen solmsi marchali TaxID=326594 RepID=A0AAJ6VKU7_9HYME|nr:PREDICTED: chondroitin sulfate synthase 2 [Ceratosolen solmsi marchali]
MSPIINILFAHCRSNLYLIIGICVGLSISLLFAPIEINDYQDLEDSLPYSISNNEVIDEYEPKINVEAKPQKAKKIPKVFVRPRYYSTELGIRDKIFVGILTSPEYLHSRAIASNKTISHLVDKVRYFISIPEGTKPNVSLPGIVGFTDTRSILQPFHALKYIIDNYLEDYDFYFLIKDTSYINARRLIDIANKISVSQDVHLGMISEDDKYCSLDGGILLSNSIIRNLKNNLDWCVKITFSSSDDVNFGRCIMHSTSIPCSNNVQEELFLSIKLNVTFNYENNFRELSLQEDFQNSATVYPIYDHSVIYKMNTYFAEVELVKVQKEIEYIREEIRKTSNFTPKNQKDLSWPIGSQPGNKALNRFDILRWTYFNMTHVFFYNDFDTIKELDSNQKEDVDYIVNATIERVIKKSDRTLKFKKLHNGYWKYDSSRGVDYLLDLSFVTDSGIEINKRIEVCKPLGKVEILPVPYVTENSRINMIVTVDLQKKEEVLKFLAHYADTCMDKKDKILLTIVFLYNPGYASKGDDDIYYEIKQRALFLTEKYKKDQLKVTWLSIRLPTISSLIEIEPLFKLAIADLYVKKFSSDNLILFADTRMEIKSEYLNRVRMNTISQWQVFSPIPFIQYHPDIIYYDEKTKHVDFDIIHSHGRYDEYNYDSVSFYVKDYMTVRKSIENQVPLVRTDKDIANILKLSKTISIGSIFEMFVVFSNLNPFRAVEPALKLRYRKIDCIGTRNNITLSTCLKQRNLQLGNRGQLTRLILDYKEHH